MLLFVSSWLFLAPSGPRRFAQFGDALTQFAGDAFLQAGIVQRGVAVAGEQEGVLRPVP